MRIREPMETEHGRIPDVEVVHCDGCGRKRLGSSFARVDPDEPWLELRRVDRDVPEIHACRVVCVSRFLRRAERLAEQLATDRGEKALCPLQLARGPDNSLRRWDVFKAAAALAGASEPSDDALLKEFDALQIAREVGDGKRRLRGF